MKYIISISGMCETCPYFKLINDGGMVEIKLKCTCPHKRCPYGMRELGRVQVSEFTNTTISDVIFKK